jgi:DNA polymerase-2
MIPPLRIKTKDEEEKAAKKRYAGLYEEKGEEKLEIVGLEAIRGDWTEAAKEFQRELLLKLFHNEEIKKFIISYIEKLKSGKLDEKLVYKKSIRKNLEEYTKTTPPHVKAARQLDKLESNVISYYITTEGPEPIQKLRHKIDYEHYIEKQIKPIANQILSLMEKNFDDIVKGSKQKTLF